MEFKPPINEKCFYCQAGCCHDVVLEIDEPSDFEEFENIRWYLYHKNVYVYIDENEWYVGFRTVCEALKSDYSCGVYAKRPHACRTHSAEDCTEYTGPGYEKSVFYDVIFETPDAFDVWLLKNNYADMIRHPDTEASPPFKSKAPKTL